MITWLETYIFGYPRLVFSSSLLIVGILFGMFFPKRKHFWVRFPIGAIVYFVLAYFTTDFGAEERFFTIVFPVFQIFFLFCLLVYLCLDVSLKDLAFICVGAFSIQNIGSRTIIVLPVFFEQIWNIGWIENFWLLRLVNALTYAVIYVICYFVFLRGLKKISHIHVTSIRMILLCSVALLLSTVLSILPYDKTIVSSVVHLLVRVLTTALIFTQVENGQEKWEKETLNELMKREEENYLFAKSNIDSINSKCHDFKYQIQAIRENIHDETADESLNQLEKEIEIYDSLPKTGNLSLDNALAPKCLYCEKHAIQFTYMVDGTALDFMKNSDVYILFGNALDNAIECEMKIQDKAKRSITLSVSKKNSIISVHMENHTEEKNRWHNGMPLTSKKNKESHGFGLKSMQLIAEKYGGNLNLEVKNQSFVLNILFPVPETKEQKAA